MSAIYILHLQAVCFVSLNQFPDGSIQALVSSVVLISVFCESLELLYSKEPHSQLYSYLLAAVSSYSSQVLFDEKLIGF